MAEISKITLPSGDEYDFKDTVARLKAKNIVLNELHVNWQVIYNRLSPLEIQEVANIYIDRVPLEIITNGECDDASCSGTVTRIAADAFVFDLIPVDAVSSDRVIIEISNVTQEEIPFCTIYTVSQKPFRGASATSTGARGLVPAPIPGEQNSFLRGDGAWAVPTNTTYSDMTGATSSAAGKHGLVPAPAAGKQTSFLRGDGSWVIPTNTTYVDMEGATASAAGTHGLVPAPAKGKQTSFLRGDGTWVVPTNTTYSVMDGASSSAAGASGLVPAPAAGKQTSFLRGDGTWVVPTNTTYGVMNPATSSTAGSSGLVPAPAKGKQTSFLRGDGNWVVPTNTTYASLAEDQDGTAVSLVTTGDKYTWNRAVLTSGTQTVNGAKTFGSTHIIQNSTTSPSIQFRGDGQDTTTGVFYYQGTQSANATYDTGYFSFYQYSPKAEGDGRTSYYDRYRLPAVAAGKTSNNTYDIITTKNLDAGSGISISGTTISNKGVWSVETGDTNGTISVTVNGFAEEVAVAGLAAAAYKGVLDGTADAALTTASTVPTVRRIRYSYYNGFDQTSAGYALDARAVNKLFILKKYEAAWTNCAVNGKIDFTGTDFGYTAFPSGYSPIGVVDYAAGNQNCVISFINARATGSGKLLRIANYSAATASAGTAVIIIAFAKDGAVDDSSL